MRIYFKEKEHQYFNENHEPYISVSGLAKKLEQSKNWEEIRLKKAKKIFKQLKESGDSSKSVKQIDAELKIEWARKKLLGTEAGTKVHKKSEEKRLSSPQALINNVTCSIFSSSFYDGFKWSEPTLKLSNNTIYPECMIYDHDFKVCGQSDEVWVINNTLHVYDIKTDKTMDRQAYTDEYNGPEKLLAPCSHLDNCNFNMYSIKMSMYMYMLWKQNKNLKIGDLLLDWQPILRDQDGIPILDENGEPTVVKSEIIEVPYRRREVKEIFDYYKAGKLK